MFLCVYVTQLLKWFFNVACIALIREKGQNYIKITPNLGSTVFQPCAFVVPASQGLRGCQWH